MTRTMILLAFVCLVLTITLPILAQQPDSTTLTDTLHPKILEERIKALEKEIGKVDAERKRELDQRTEALGEEIDKRSGELGTQMNLYLGIVFAFLGIFGYLGHKTVVRWIQQTIREKTDDLFRENEIDFRKRAEREADKLLKDMIAKGQKKIDALEDEGREKLSAMDADREEFRAKGDRLITELRAKASVPGKKLSEESAMELAEYTVGLSVAKKEDEYTSEDWFLKAYDADEKGDHETALDMYSRAIELDPEDESLYVGRANALFMLERYEEALRDYSRALELEPEEAVLYFNRGNTLRVLKRYKDALVDIDEAIKLRDLDSDTYKLRGHVFIAVRQYDRALADYQRACELNPSNVDNYMSAAEAELFLGSYESALLSAERALSVSTKHEDIAGSLFEKCIALRLLGSDTHATEQDLDEALQKDFEIDWIFDGMENWLKTADIPDDARKFIQEKTELLKAKQKKKE